MTSVGYTDKAAERRRTKGSDNPYQKDDAPASVHRLVPRGKILNIVTVESRYNVLPSSFQSIAPKSGRWRLRTLSIALVKPPSVHDSIFRIQSALGRPLSHGPGMSDSITNKGKLSGLRFQCPYLATFRLITVLSIPFILLTPTVCLTHSFVFFVSQLHSRQHHSSNDSIILSSSSFRNHTTPHSRSAT